MYGDERSLVAILTFCVGLSVVHTGAAEVTFTKDIAPIIFEKCTSCHRPGEAAPFALQNYDDVKKRVDLIEYVVEQRIMPPWKAAAGDVEFRGDRRLSDPQRQLMTDWIKQGSPEGDPKDLPPLPQFTPGWSLGEPDLIVSMKDAYTVPAEGPDIYRNFVIPLGLETDRWVTALDFRPSARSVVHHSLFFFESTGRARKMDEEDPEPGFKGGMGAINRLRGGRPGMATDKNSNDGERKSSRGLGDRLNSAADDGKEGAPPFGALGGWALGAQPRFLPEGLAFHLPAGADLILSTHFHPSGKAEQETSTVGIYFAKGPTTRRFTGIQLPPLFGALKNIDIPPGTKEYVIEDSFELPVDVEAFGISAHAHYLGKTFTSKAVLPSGETKTLLSIPDWDFAWQEQYQFANYVFLPKGTQIHSRITYDNSAENPRNPTLPPIRVRFGEESTDEMGSMTLQVVAAQEAEMPELQTRYRAHVRESMAKAPLLKMLQNRTGSD
jgi:hypothetical protein